MSPKVTIEKTFIQNLIRNTENDLDSIDLSSEAVDNPSNTWFPGFKLISGQFPVFVH